MELTEYVWLIRKWFWLLLICGFIGGGVSYIINTGRPPIYEASTTVSIGNYINSPNPNTAEIAIGLNLVRTYAEIVRTNDVLQSTIDALNLKMPPQQLKNLVNANIVEGTSLMVITIQYTDPILAADIANTLAQQLISQSPTNLTASQQGQIDYATSQINALDQQLQQQRKSVDDIDSQLEKTQDSQEIARLTDLRTTLTDQITRATSAIATFQSTISSIQQRTNALDIVERASIPTVPQSSGALSNTIVGVAVGAIVAIGAAFVIEYLDDRLKTAEIAAQMVELPVLGTIPRFGKKRASYTERLISEDDFMTPVAEAYRRLQTNIMLSAEDHTNVFVVTSPGPSEGKSVSAANLATTMANDGVRVLLIDADLRKPTQHKIFGLENQTGLSTLLIADADNRGPFEFEQDKRLMTRLDQCIQSTTIPNLKVITSGFAPSNPTQVLRSSLMKRWIGAFRTARDIDVIIMDTPPVLLFGDSVILSTVAEADVLLVIDSQRTRVKAAQETKKQLVQVGIGVRGIILNRIDPRDGIGRYGYGYNYGYYYPPEESKQAATGRRKLWPWHR